MHEPIMPPVGRPFLLRDEQLRSSLQVDASEQAMRRVWAKLESGLPLSIGVLGSSVGMSGGCQVEYQPQLRCSQFDGVQVQKRFARGYGVVDSEMRGLLHNADRPVRGFVLQVLDWINATWPHHAHRIENAAVDAWTAKAIEPCLLSNERITASDLLLLELGSQGWHPSQAAASERIIRKLLRIASGDGGVPPAMVMVTTRQWCGHSVHGLRRKERPVVSRTWAGIEDVFASFCTAYGMACLSMRDAIFHDVVAGRPNFTVADVAADCLHPEQSRFGYHYMADVIIHFMRRSWLQYKEQRVRSSSAVVHAKVTVVHAKVTRASLPPAIVLVNRGREGHMSWRCYDFSTAATADAAMLVTMQAAARPQLLWQSMGGDGGAAPIADMPACDVLRRCVLKATRTQNGNCLRGRGHWQFCTRTLAPRAAYKPGLVSLLPGADLRFVVDARAPFATVVHAANGTSGQPGDAAVLALTYLTSYQDMGVASVSCQHGCSCVPQRLDAIQLAQPSDVPVPTLQRHRSGADRTITRNVSVATVMEIPIRDASRACAIRIVNIPRAGSDKLAVAKWKLLQVRIGWDVGT
jgi:hypothetical protein